MKAGAQGSRFGILVNRLWGLGNQDTPIDVAPEVLPTTDLTSSRTEYLAPRGETPWSFSRSEGVTASEFSYIGIRNPAGSRLCVIVEDVHHYSATVQLLTQTLTADEALTASSALRSRDRRLPNNPVNPFPIVGSEAAVVGDNMGLIGVGFAAGRLPIGVVLPPGSIFRFWQNAAATALLELNVRGYFRRCDPEEMRV